MATNTVSLPTPITRVSVIENIITVYDGSTVSIMAVGSPYNLASGYIDTTELLSTEYNLAVGYLDAIKLLSSGYSLGAYELKNTLLGNIYNLGAYSTEEYSLGAKYDLFSYTVYSNTVGGAYNLSAYLAGISQLGASYALNAYAAGQTAISAKYALDAYTPAVSHLDSHYALSVYTMVRAVVQGKYDLSAYQEFSYPLNASYNLNAWQQIISYLHAAYGLDAHEAFYGWLINKDTKAASRYEGFKFNSLDGEFGAMDDGIYQLTGTTNNGVAINAFIETGLMDFGKPQLKHVNHAYIRAYDNLQLSLDMTGSETINYLVSPTGDEPGKAHLAKGDRARKWKLKLSNVNGGGFELESIELDEEVLSRRV